MAGSAISVTCPSCGGGELYTIDSEPELSDGRVAWYLDETDHVMQRRESSDGEVLELRRVSGDVFCALCHAHVAGPAVSRRVVDLTDAQVADESADEAATARVL